jgi:hypothetical protein
VRLNLFTVEEANRMLAELRPLLEDLVAAREELAKIDQRLEVLALAAAGASSANPDAMEHGRAAEGRGQLVERMKRGIREIQRRGPVVKDLEHGLLDFYSLAGDRLIFLCWQLGETEVGHWHTLDAGFAGRQPLHRTEQE